MYSLNQYIGALEGSCTTGVAKVRVRIKYRFRSSFEAFVPATATHANRPILVYRRSRFELHGENSVVVVVIMVVRC